jgi:hypothetical protein
MVADGEHDVADLHFVGIGERQSGKPLIAVP